MAFSKGLETCGDTYFTPPAEEFKVKRLQNRTPTGRLKTYRMHYLVESAFKSLPAYFKILCDFSGVFEIFIDMVFLQSGPAAEAHFIVPFICATSLTVRPISDMHIPFKQPLICHLCRATAGHYEGANFDGKKLPCKALKAYPMKHYTKRLKGLSPKRES
jgi:hypothetical protein